MEATQYSAVDLVFGTPELLESILLVILARVPPPEKFGHNGPRSVRTRLRAKLMMDLLRCTEVSRSWRACILGSHRLKRGLFLCGDHTTGRSWRRTGESSDDVSMKPLLNPIMVYLCDISFTIPRFQAPLNVLASDHCVHLYINRDKLHRDRELRVKCDQGSMISSMLLSQPPCVTLKEDGLIGRSNLQDPLIDCETGITLGLVHQRSAEMFEDHASRASEMPKELRNADGLMLFSG